MEKADLIGVIVKCETKYEADKCCEIASILGCKWWGGDSFAEVTCYEEGEDITNYYDFYEGKLKEEEEVNKLVKKGLCKLSTAQWMMDTYDTSKSLSINKEALDELNKRRNSYSNINKLEQAEESENTTSFKEITSEMLETYIKKNADYGGSFDKSMNEFGLISAVIRMSDKIERLKSLVKQDAKVKEESIEDTLYDLASYAVMTLINLKKNNYG